CVKAPRLQAVGVLRIVPIPKVHATRPTTMTICQDHSATRSARWSQLAALVVLVVVLWAPAPADLPGPAQRVAAVAAAMAILWLTQAVPIGATSLIPLAAFPLLGVQ